MNQYGQSLKSNHKQKGVAVIALADKLQDKICSFVKNIEHFEPPIEALEQFKTDFIALLHSEDKVMNAHSRIWKPIVANILIALSGVGLLAIIAKAVTHVITAKRKEDISFNRAFFFARTHSQQNIDNVEHEMRNTCALPYVR